MCLHEICLEFRTRDKLTQEQLAKKMHLGVDTIIKIEAGDFDDDDFMCFYFRIYFSYNIALLMLNSFFRML